MGVKVLGGKTKSVIGMYVNERTNVPTGKSVFGPLACSLIFSTHRSYTKLILRFQNTCLRIFTKFRYMKCICWVLGSHSGYCEKCSLLDYKAL
jgi:hypothetical protein